MKLVRHFWTLITIFVNCFPQTCLPSLYTNLHYLLRKFQALSKHFLKDHNYEKNSVHLFNTNYMNKNLLLKTKLHNSISVLQWKLSILLMCISIVCEANSQWHSWDLSNFIGYHKRKMQLVKFEGVLPEFWPGNCISIIPAHSTHFLSAAITHSQASRFGQQSLLVTFLQPEFFLYNILTKIFITPMFGD